jgi:hypothetical protein
MKQLAVASVIPVLFLLGCGGDSNRQGGASTAGSSSQTDDSRSVGIYSSVIRQLVTKDHTFGQGDRCFKVVYILDGPVEGAEDSMKTTAEYEPASPFGKDVKAALKERLAGLPPIVFVRDRASAIAGDNAGSLPGHVVNDGVLLTLGPISGGARRVEVGSNLWIDGRAGLWITYVFKLRGGEWKATGTTSTVAIS